MRCRFTALRSKNADNEHYIAGRMLPSHFNISLSHALIKSNCLLCCSHDSTIMLIFFMRGQNNLLLSVFCAHTHTRLSVVLFRRCMCIDLALCSVICHVWRSSQWNVNKIIKLIVKFTLKQKLNTLFEYSEISSSARWWRYRQTLGITLNNKFFMIFRTYPISMC